MTRLVKPGVYRMARPADNFTIVSHEFSRSRLPARAIKVGLYVLSHREGFTQTQEQIGRAIKLTAKTVAAALEDLERAGFLLREDVRNELGHRLGTAYGITDQPIPQSVKIPDGDSPDGVSTDHKKTSSRRETTKPKKTTPSGGARSAAPVPSLEVRNNEEEEPVAQQADNLTLFDAPPKAEKAKAPKPPASPGAHTVVAAYVDAYRRTHGGADPIKSHIMRVGREAKEILGRGEAGPEELARAAVALGGTEYLALGIQLSRLRKSAGPVAGQRQGMAPASPHTDEYWQEAGKRNDESWYQRLLTDDAAVEWVKGDPAQVEEILRKWPELETRLRGAA